MKETPESDPVFSFSRMKKSFWSWFTDGTKLDIVILVLALFSIFIPKFGPSVLIVYLVAGTALCLLLLFRRIHRQQRAEEKQSNSVKN